MRSRRICADFGKSACRERTLTTSLCWYDQMGQQCLLPHYKNSTIETLTSLSLIPLIEQSRRVESQPLPRFHWDLIGYSKWEQKHHCVKTSNPI
ncbi:UNVERIFIED_CONTAM: hypothetical protein FKN15_038578 [Acipenser sinensis]